ncbi:glutaminase, partial [Cooperia oncophora]
CKNASGGTVSDYIPQLARQNPHLWGVSICTIDGQRVSLGDYKKKFCLQSVSKAFTYSIVASDLGPDVVHSYVGHEPSGRIFDEICLDGNGKPHNPMINAGAIIVTSLLKRNMTMADRFDFALQEYRKMAGGEHIGFDNATFLSERDAADRNYALSYYMKENDCFPSGTKSLREELELYFQLCSMETNCDTLSVSALLQMNVAFRRNHVETCSH